MRPAPVRRPVAQHGYGQPRRKPRDPIRSHCRAWYAAGSIADAWRASEWAASRLPSRAPHSVHSIHDGFSPARARLFAPDPNDSIDLRPPTIAMAMAARRSPPFAREWPASLATGHASLYVASLASA